MVYLGGTNIRLIDRLTGKILTCWRMGGFDDLLEIKSSTIHLMEDKTFL